MDEGTISDGGVGVAAGGAGDDGGNVTAGGGDSNMHHTVRLRVEGMMCQKNCGESSQKHLTVLKHKKH